MIEKLFASLAAAETLIAAGVLGLGVALVAEPGYGLAVFGGAWYLSDLLGAFRRTR